MNQHKKKEEEEEEEEEEEKKMKEKKTTTKEDDDDDDEEEDDDRRRGGGGGGRRRRRRRRGRRNLGSYQKQLPDEQHEKKIYCSLDGTYITVPATPCQTWSHYRPLGPCDDKTVLRKSTTRSMFICLVSVGSIRSVDSLLCQEPFPCYFPFFSTSINRAPFAPV